MRTRTIGNLDVTVVGIGCNNFGGADRQGRDGRRRRRGARRRHQLLRHGRRLRRHPQRGVPRPGPRVPPGRGGDRDEVRHAAAGRRRRRVARVRPPLRRGEPEAARHGPDRPLPAPHGPTPPRRSPTRSARSASSSTRARSARSGARTSTPRSSREARGGLAGCRPAFVSVQNHYSILHREPEAEVLEACEELGVAFLPFFPLANGLLTGKYRPGEPAPADSRLGRDEARRAAR